MIRLPRQVVFIMFVIFGFIGFVAANTTWWIGVLLVIFALAVPMGYVGYVYYYGTAKAMRGDLQSAINHYTRILQWHLPVDKVLVYTRRAALRNAVGDIDGAISDYSSAMNYIPGGEDPAIYAIRSALYLGKRNYEKALNDSERLLAMRPESEIGYANRAAARMFLGDVEGAIDDCTTGLEKENSASGKALLYNNRGTAYRMAGDYNESMSDYNLAMSAALNDHEKQMIHPSIITNQGILYHIQNEYDHAKAYFQKALGVNPGFYKSLVGLAAARFKLGQVPEAQKLWMDLIQREPRYRSPQYLQSDLNLPMQLMSDVSDLMESMTV